MDTACAVAIDGDVGACQDERSAVVLEGDGVVILAPVGDVWGELLGVNDAILLSDMYRAMG